VREACGVPVTASRGLDAGLAEQARGQLATLPGPW
jgi:hypothetical protein